MHHLPLTGSADQQSGAVPTRRRLGRSFGASVAVAVLVSGLVACTDNNDSSDNETDELPTAPIVETVATVQLAAADSPTGPIITATIEAPNDAADMQVGLTSRFEDSEWVPVANSAELSAFEGYQEVFVRFRDAAGEPTEFTVTGIDVDTRAEAATADPPRPIEVGLVTPTILSTTVEVGRITRGLEQAGDTLVGASVPGERFDSGWTLTGDGAPSVSVASRESVPTNGGRDTDGEMTLFSMRHTVALELSAPLADGATYTLTSPLGSSIEFTVDDRSLDSPAVHANQYGYGTTDSKVAYYSVADDLDGSASAPAFTVIDEAGAEFATGTGVARTVTDEAGKGEVTGAAVWQLDFSSVTEPGRYSVCVDGIGCSSSFDIGDDTWSSLATTVARSLYYQRTGTELNRPYGSFSRPRANHPDDGTIVYETGLTGFEASEQTDETLFDSIAEKQTTTPVADAWGGHFDAGDWDRRTQHLFMARQLLDVARQFPDAFPDGSLNLPESSNGVSDIADEALWTVDLFERLQRDDGAVRGGIESERFPDWGTPSWTDTITRYAYAPDPWTSWVYASVAADAALLLADADPERSAAYSASALAAWDWAETQPVPQTEGDPSNSKVVSQRATAAASLLELTGESRFAEAFAEPSGFADGPKAALGCHANEWCDAGWRYLDVPEELTDPSIRANITESFTTLAGRIVDASDDTRFGWCLEDPGVPMVWGMGVGGNPHLITLLRASMLSGDARFLTAAQRCSAVSLGANPLNQSFITGIGTNPVRHPLLGDASFGGLPVWPGIPVYGTHPLSDLNWVEQYRLRPAGSNVSSSSLPLLRSWYDLPDVAAMNEFTIYQSQSPVIWSFAALAALAG